MRSIKSFIGISLLFAVGMMLAACASSTATEPVDQEPQVDSTESTLYVGPLLVDCESEGPQKCMLVKENLQDDYTLFYDQIEGFDYEEGFEYLIVVNVAQVENPPAGGSSLRYSLVRIDSKELVPILEVVKEKTIYIGPELVDCEGVAPQKCMLTKENPEDEYSLFYDQIEGFDYEEGYEYKLLIREEQVEDPPADASSIKWTLVQVENKKPVAVSGAEQFKGTDWELVSYTDQSGEPAEPLPGTHTTARFEDGQVNGIAGCNNYFGGYELDGNNIIVGPLASTEMFCGNPPGVMDQEIAYLTALGNAATYTIEGDQLIIADSDGETVLVFQIAEPKSLTGNLWKVLSYNNGREAVVSVIIETELTAVFDEEGQVTGSAGCNNYSAEYVVDSEKIQIGPAITTRMACNDPEGIMGQEMDYLAALEMASSYQFEDDRLILLDAEGRRVVDYQLARTFELTETIWYLQNFFDGNGEENPVLVGTEITAFFEEDGNLSGSAGCNNYSGAYQVEANMIEIELGPLTMMFCEQPEGAMDQETAYLEKLDSVTRYRIIGDILLMEDEGGQVVLEFKASDLVGYLWMWVEFLENNDTITRPDIPGNYTLEFLPDGTLNLQADCNSASGPYTVKGNQLDIEILTTTLAVCPPESLSEEYLRLLDDAVAYIRQGEFLYIDIMLDTGTMKFFPQ